MMFFIIHLNGADLLLDELSTGRALGAQTLQVLGVDVNHGVDVQQGSDGLVLGCHLCLSVSQLLIASSQTWNT